MKRFYIIFYTLFFCLFACSQKSMDENQNLDKNPKEIFEKIVKKSLKIKMILPKPRSFTELRKYLSKNIPLKILCFGNSITYGFSLDSSKRVEKPYPQKLQEILFKKYKNDSLSVINEGHNGWRSDHALDHFEELITPQNADLVIVKFGINDAYSNFPAYHLKKNLTLLVQKIKKQKSLVLLLTPTPTNTVQNKIIETYLPIIEAVAKEQKVGFLNIHKFFNQKIKVEKLRIEEVLPDNVHLEASCYQWISEWVAVYLETAL
jgi:lysophospholipase L1-like esterase